ncbi:MAG: acyltransferase [Clostridia bacterium]|nr:acyltransferase [Clostridia bacterium]
MVFFLAALLVLCLVGIKFSGKNGFEDYMSPQKTGSIKGVFTVIVLFSHVRQYLSLDASPFNKPYVDFLSFLGQLMVVMFLFYSGYGVTLGLMKKEGYVKTLLSRRALKVWIHFDIAVLIYWLLGLALGKNYPVKKLLLSFIGLDSVGSSIWFIFVTLILYIVTWLSFRFIKKRIIISTCIATLLSVVAVILLFVFKKYESWWYDTLLCYPLGMWYAIAKPYIDKALLPNIGKWLACTGVTLTAFITLYYFFEQSRRDRAIFVPMSFIFTLLLVFISMRMSVNNGVLRWLGTRVFGVYILQRIPMTILYHFGFNNNPVVFAAISFAVTLLIAEGFERCMALLDKKLDAGINKISFSTKKNKA